MKVPKMISAAVLLLLPAIPTLGNGINFTKITSLEEWNAAFEKAKSENKLVFADAYTNWCGYCHKLDKEVYTDEKIINYFNDAFINLKFDAESAFGTQLAKHYGVEGYPTLLFLSQSKKVLELIGGFVPASTLMAYGKQTRERYERLPELEAKYANLSITKDERLELIGALEAINPEKAQEVAQKHIAGLTPEDYKSVETLWLLARFENQISGVPYRYITSHKEDIMEWHGEKEYKDYIKAAYNDNLQLSIKYGDRNLLNELITKVLTEFMSDFDQAEGAYATKKLFFGQRQEYDEYKLVVRQYLNNNVAEFEKETFLFSNALELVERHKAKSMYEFASELLTQLVDTNGQHFEGTALLGYTNALLGKYQLAESQLEKAQNLAHDDEERNMVVHLKEAVSNMKQSDSGN